MKRLKNDPNVATVKNIIKHFNAGGVKAVQIFLNREETVIWEDTWASKIRDLLNEGKNDSTVLEIALISFNLDFINQLDEAENGEETRNNNTSNRQKETS